MQPPCLFEQVKTPLSLITWQSGVSGDHMLPIHEANWAKLVFLLNQTTPVVTQHMPTYLWDHLIWVGPVADCEWSNRAVDSEYFSPKPTFKPPAVQIGMICLFAWQHNPYLCCNRQINIPALYPEQVWGFSAPLLQQPQWVWFYTASTDGTETSRCKQPEAALHHPGRWVGIQHAARSLPHLLLLTCSWDHPLLSHYHPRLPLLPLPCLSKPCTGHDQPAQPPFSQVPMMVWSLISVPNTLNSGTNVLNGTFVTFWAVAKVPQDCAQSETQIIVLLPMFLAHCLQIQKHGTQQWMMAVC